jgi:hypothetical protein
MSSPAVWVPRKRRGAEFFLTILAVGIGVMSYCAVGLGVEGRVPAGAMGLALGLVGLAVAAHFVIRRVAPYADPVLLPLVLCLNGLGLAMIYRLDLGRQQIDPSRQAFAGGQLVWTVVGLAAFSAVLIGVRDHRRLQSVTYTSASPLSSCWCCRCCPSSVPASSTARASGSTSARSASSPARQPRCASPSSSPGTWW